MGLECAKVNSANALGHVVRTFGRCAAKFEAVAVRAARRWCLCVGLSINHRHAAWSAQVQRGNINAIVFAGVRTCIFWKGSRGNSSHAVLRDPSRPWMVGATASQILMGIPPMPLWSSSLLSLLNYFSVGKAYLLTITLSTVTPMHSWVRRR